MAYTTISVTGDVTLSASKGITIADGTTLTINGPGTLTVSNSTEAAAGANASGRLLASQGEVGYPGIAGNVVVNSGTVNVTGGTGGKGGDGSSNLTQGVLRSE